MLAFLIKRIFSGIFVLLGIMVFAFLLIHMIPGDPVGIMLGQNATPDQVKQLTEQLGLNKPLVVQFFDYFIGVISGDLGMSYKSGRPVLVEILERLPYTLRLVFAAITFATILGIGLGILAAKHKNTWLDRIVMFFSTLGVSIPGYWLCILLIIVFVVKLGFLPIAGGTGMKDLTLPATAMGLLLSTIICRLTRTGMIEVLSSDYIRTARSKGLSETVVMLRHALRNVLIPVVTIIGLQLAGLLGGSIIIEQVFTWPGLGTLSIGAIASRDFPMVQGMVLFMGFVYVTINILVDILYHLLDPRIKFGQEKGGI